jgi:WD40 repeat protein
MEQTRWNRIEELLQAALDLAPGEREAFLKQACAGDEALRREVEEMLGKADEAEIVLEKPAIAHVAAQMVRPTSLLDVGQVIGRYRVEMRLGAGGMGEVWKAWDENLGRAVALKLLPAEFTADAAAMRRFAQEARTLSALNHPNILTIYEVSQSNDLHFIVTEFVTGETLRDYLRQKQPDWRAAVQISTQIADALHAAHTADIIHRDIKPENVMVQSNGHVKVLDFGIAKLNEEGETERGRDREKMRLSPLSPSPHFSVSPSLTRPGTILGTARYMSPEQARGEPLDARTDIFSLGIALYEMLAGRRPYGEASGEDLIGLLTSPDKIKPISLVCRDIPAALERIVARTLRKRREDRYASAGELLADLKELKASVEVSRQEQGERLFRAQNANRLLTQAVTLYTANKKTRLALGTLWTVWRFADLKRGRLEGELIGKSLLSGLARLGMLMLVVALATMSVAAVWSVQETWDERVLRDGHTAAVRRAVFSPDGSRLVSVGEDKQVIVWDFARRERLATFNDHSDWVAAVAFSPDGKRFATGGYDKTVIVWDAVKLQKETVLHGHRDAVVSLAFSPDGKMLVSSAKQPDVSDDETIIWHVGSWEKFAQIPSPYTDASSLLFIPGSNRMVYHTNFSPGDHSNTWDVATAQPLSQQFDPAWSGNNAAFSPDGTLLVSIHISGEVIFANFKRRQTLNRFKAHQDNGRAVAFSPDGRLVATGAENIILWDAVTRGKITTIDYPSIVWSAAFSPNGRWLVTTHGDGGIRVWDVKERQRAIGFNEHNGPVRAVAWARDGKRFASAGEDSSVMVWNAESGRRERLLTGHPTRVTGLAFAPDGNTLASVDREGLMVVWELAQRREWLQFRHPKVVNASANCLAISPDGRMIATSHGVYDRITGQQVADFITNDPKGNHWLSSSALYGLDFSTDGTRLAAANSSGYPFVSETATWQLVEKADLRPRQFISVSFAPDGKHLVTGEDGGTVQLWTAQPLRPTTVIGQHEARIKSVAFSPDGKRVVSAGDDKMIALWDVSRRKLITRIGLHTAPVYAIAFSPDGKQLVSGGHDHSVRLYTRRRMLWGWRLD